MRIARSTGALSGFLVVLLGVWGALIPFVGPYFDYSFGTNATWHYTTDRLWLSILPGAAAVVGGLLLMFAGTRLAGIVGGWLGVAAGAWFAVGPAVALTWETGPGPIGRPLFGSTRQMLELVGYFYGLGAVIVALSAFAIGRFASRPRLAEEAPLAGSEAPAAAEAPTAAEAAPAAAPARRESLARRTRGAEPARRRRGVFPFSRRRARARDDDEAERDPAEAERDAPERRSAERDTPPPEATTQRS